MKRYVIVGSGNRAIEMFIKPIIKQFSKDAVISAVLDLNLKRAEFVKNYIPYDVKIYDDFDKMQKEVEADVCIIATTDCYHEFYIRKALSYNLIVICEKPVVISKEQCKALLSLEKEKQDKIIITFNSRYMPANMKIKELLEKEKIGKILYVQYQYMIDKEHGAEYFRRWHRYREKSGSLLVHKSVHHFDLINWWLHDIPNQVLANGRLNIFGDSKKEHGYRCRNCNYHCEYELSDKQNLQYRELYYDNEYVDGYIRDKCVFDEDINTYDTMNVSVLYNRGAMVNYSLILYAAYTGFQLIIVGEHGQIMMDFNQTKQFNNIFVYKENGEIDQHNVESFFDKKHNGGDECLQNKLFKGKKLEKLPSLEDGINAVLVGLAAVKSIEEKRKIAICELTEELV